jgi:hypothetical protein
MKPRVSVQIRTVAENLLVYGGILAFLWWFWGHVFAMAGAL